MEPRGKLILISIWLFLSFPFSVAVLKFQTKIFLWLAVDQAVSLNNYLVIQYLVVAFFVIGTIALLFRHTKLGRSFAIFLLLSNAFIMASPYLLAVPYALLSPSHSHWPTLIGDFLNSFFIIGDAICLWGLASLRPMPDPKTVVPLVEVT